MSPRATPRRAVGIVRVSQTKGREGESFHSPGEQRARIEEAAQREGLELVGVVEELDTSGGTPLAKRHGLREAVEAVEAGRVEVIVAAYFDRLVRSLKVQGELVERVEAAGGSVLAVDFGKVSGGSATQRLTAHFLGAVAQYHRDATAERSREAQARAVARGVLPWPNVPPGYVKTESGTLEPDPKTVGAVRRAFELRAEGATVADVRAHLAAHGIDRSYHGTQAILRSRVYLGELVFGELVNLAAWPAVIEPDLWRRVQAASTPRGRRPSSDRLLARLGVLRCASCDGRMVVGMQRQNGRAYPFYKCPSVRADCDRRVTISAELVEGLVVDAVRSALADVEGRASAEANVREAERALADAQARLDTATRTVLGAGLLDEPAAVEQLAALKAERDAAEERVEGVGGHEAAVTVTAARDWERLTSDERRALIRATVARVTISPGGKGADRVAVELLGE